MLQTSTGTAPKGKAPDINKYLSPLTPDLNLKDFKSLQIPSGPPSPAISHLSFMSSMSWMAEKSTTELVPMLKNAYTALKDKEKDLVLAAELGKSLLDYNMRLKSKYDSLLTQQQQTTAAVFSTASTTATTATTNATCAGTFTPPITPSTSTQDNGSFTTAANKNAGIMLDLMFEATESEEDDEMMKFIPSSSAREAMIEVLERKNTELSQKLELAIREKDSLSHTHSKRTKELEMDIQRLKSNLEIATTKIQELQDINERQKRQRMLEEQKQKEQESLHQTKLVDELILQVGELQTEKEALLQSKADLESKLVTTLQDLTELKHQFHTFEFSQRNMEELQQAYEKQFQHIDELNHSLEEHRALLQKLKEKGIQIYTPTPSERNSTNSYDIGNDLTIDGYFSKSSLLEELGSAWRMNKEDEMAASPSTHPSSPLLYSSMTTANQKSSTATTCDQTYSALPSIFLKDSLLVKSFYRPPSTRTNSNNIVDFESVLSKATGIDQSLIDDALQFIDQIEMQHQKEKYLTRLNQQIVDESSTNKIEEDRNLPAFNLYPHAKLTSLSQRLQQGSSSVNSKSTPYASVKKPSILLRQQFKLKACILSIFQMIWRWCRFAIVLTIALFISAAKGPDSLRKAR